MESWYVGLFAFGIPILIAILAFYRRGPLRRSPNFGMFTKPRLSDSDFVDRVAKTAERPFYDARAGGHWTIRWDCWRVLSDALLTRELRYRFWHSVSPTVAEIDAICVLSLGAVELIRPFVGRWNKPVLVPSQLGEWSQRNPEKSRIAVVDIAIHAGYTLTMAMDVAALAGLKVRYLWAAMYNDMDETLPEIHGIAKKVLQQDKESLVRSVLLTSEMLTSIGYGVDAQRPVDAKHAKASSKLVDRAEELDRLVKEAFVSREEIASEEPGLAPVRPVTP